MTQTLGNLLMTGIDYHPKSGLYAIPDENGRFTEDSAAAVRDDTFRNGGLPDTFHYLCSGQQLGDWIARESQDFEEAWYDDNQLNPDDPLTTAEELNLENDWLAHLRYEVIPFIINYRFNEER